MRNGASYKHLAICSMSFSGSTALSYRMGACPGVANIGESHWLTRGAPGQRDHHCLECHENCEFLDEDLRERLASTDDWYATIAARFGSSILVSSDKNPDLLRRLDPSESFFRIILYKHPLSGWKSHKRYVEENNIGFTPRQYMNTWSRLYKSHIDRSRPGERSIVNYHDFTHDPDKVIESIFNAAGVPAPQAPENWWQVPQHCIGGNPGLNTRIQHDRRNADIVPAPALRTFDGLDEQSEDLVQAMQIFETLEMHQDNVSRT